MIMSRERKLQALLAACEESKDLYFNSLMYKRERVPIGVGLCFFAKYARTKANVSYFIEKDIDSCKQFFYLTSQLILASSKEREGETFEVGTSFLGALLSDNLEVIKKFSMLETDELLKERNNPLRSRFHVHMIQLALRGDDEALLEKIGKISKNGRRSDKEEYGSGSDFYSLLIKRDKDALENLIQNKHAYIKSSEPLDEEFMSYLGALETKLCWLRDIPVKINHPLIPMDLMPIRPLDQYDDVYDFLKPEWVPPKQGMLADAARWIKDKVGIRK
ncbi:hypothetical protein [Pseudoduganella violacea]|uniref:Uncharacterized protein n=1 Tax=Pseudoduganella violacea TaxID=1715466 RepID=A0A7W5FVY9_9BURK|nr:hypothetical protein [Pseudoduganella violacea]MBB3121281.1 hypothetical protein [Pseudoduganella violacea]